MIKINEIHLPCKYGTNCVTGTCVINDKSYSHSFLWEFCPPLSDDVITSVSEATLMPWQEIAYFRNAKIAIAENFTIYFAYNFSTSGFALPLPYHFGKG